MSKSKLAAYLDFTLNRMRYFSVEDDLVYMDLSVDDQKPQRIVIKLSRKEAEGLKRICIELSGKGVGISDGKQLRGNRNLLRRINNKNMLGDDFLKQNKVIAQQKHEEFFQCTAYVLSSTADVFMLFTHMPLRNRYHVVLGEVINEMGTIEKFRLSTPSTSMIDITKFGEVPVQEEENYVRKSVIGSKLFRDKREKKKPLVYLDLSLDKKPSKKIVIKLSGNDSESFRRICIELSGKGVEISDGKRLCDDKNLLHRIYKLGYDFSEQNEFFNVRRKHEHCSFQCTTYVVSTAADGPTFILFTHIHFQNRCHAVLGEVKNGMGAIQQLRLPFTMMVDITGFGEIPKEEETNYVAKSVKGMSDDKENLNMAEWIETFFLSKDNDHAAGTPNSVFKFYLNKRLYGSKGSGSKYVFRTLKKFTPVRKPPRRCCREGSPTGTVKFFYAFERKYNSSCEFSSSWRLISYEESCEGPLRKKKKNKIIQKKPKMTLPGVPMRHKDTCGVVTWIPCEGASEDLEQWKKYYSSSSESEPESESGRVGKKNITALLTGEGEKEWRNPWVVSDKKKYRSYKLYYSDSEVYSIRKAFNEDQPSYFLSIIPPLDFYLSE